MTLSELSVDVTYRCAFACSFCSSHQSACPVDMSRKVALAVGAFANWLRERRRTRILVAVTGGEPTTMAELRSYIALWKAGGLDSLLCTTAAIARSSSYWSRLREAGLCRCRVSLHSTTQTSAHRIFGHNYDLDVVSANLDKMVAAGLNVDANFVVSRLSRESSDDVVSYAARHAIGRVRVLGLAKQGRALANWRRVNPSSAEVKSLTEGMTKSARAAGIALEFAGLPGHRVCTHSSKAGRCLGGVSFFHVTTDGSIYPCPAAKSRSEARLGSVMDNWQGTTLPRRSTEVPVCCIGPARQTRS